MPVKASSKIEWTVGDDCIIKMDDDVIPCTVSKLKGKNYIVEDKDGSTYECEPEELLPPEGKKKKAKEEEEEEETPKKKKKVVEEEEEETPKKKKKDEDEDEKPEKETKKVSGWNKTTGKKPGNVGFPVGNWEALVFNGVAEAKGKEVSAYLELVGVNDDEVTGKTQRLYYQLKDEKGKWLEGVEWFKGALEMLGYDDDALEVEDEDDNDEFVAALNKALKKLRKSEPWVSVRAKPNKKDKQYINLYLNGLMEDQDDKPENPLSGDDLPY